MAQCGPMSKETQQRTKEEFLAAFPHLGDKMPAFVLGVWPSNDAGGPDPNLPLSLWISESKTH